jgi:Flp pilus assembly protein TadD
MQPRICILELQVNELLTRGRATEARDLLASFVKEDPNDADMLALLGFCEGAAGNAVRAEQLLKQAHLLNPRALQPRVNLGLLYIGLGRNSEAEVCLRHAADLGPGNAAIQANLALVVERQERMEEAEQLYRTAASLDPGSVEIRFNLATFLARLNRNEEARNLFLSVINEAPGHFGAWNNLGKLLFETGHVSAAHTAYSAAVSYRPNDALVHANFGNVLLHMDDLRSAEREFETALSLRPGLPAAHQGLSSVFHRLGDEARASDHRNAGFAGHAISTLDYRGRSTPIPLLILASAVGGNIPWRFLIDQDRFSSAVIAVEYFDHEQQLPPHRLIFNAIGDADLCQGSLEIAKSLIAKSDAPVINHPDEILKTGRIANAVRLALLPGVISPRMIVVAKSDFIPGAFLERLKRDKLGFPLLIRAPGYHGGNYFFRIEHCDELWPSVNNLPGDAVFVTEFLDSRSCDSVFRKYRVMSIDGCIYPIHLAISPKWKVHYFTSDMANNEQYRKEEEAYLNDFASFLGPSTISALEGISRTLGLDYCGIDFGVDRDGNVLLYEANATMTIGSAPDHSMWGYKRTAIANATIATKRMFRKRISVA